MKQDVQARPVRGQSAQPGLACIASRDSPGAAEGYGACRRAETAGDLLTGKEDIQGAQDHRVDCVDGVIKRNPTRRATSDSLHSKSCRHFTGALFAEVKQPLEERVDARPVLHWERIKDQTGFQIGLMVCYTLPLPT